MDCHICISPKLSSQLRGFLSTSILFRADVQKGITMKNNTSDLKTIMIKIAGRVNLLLEQQNAPFYVKIWGSDKEFSQEEPAFWLFSKDPHYSCALVYWKSYLKTYSDKKLVDFFTRLFKNNSHDISTNFSRNFILKYVLPRVLGKNDVMDLKIDRIRFSYLEDLPDFIASYYIKYGNTITDITDSIVADAGITTEELHEAAVRNILNSTNIQPVFYSAKSHVASFSNKGNFPDMNPTGLWITTNPVDLFSAGALAGGQKMFELISERLASPNYFLFPVGIDFLLLLLDFGQTEKTVRSFLNATKRLPFPHSERLSKNVYHFDYTTRRITKYM